MISGRRIAFTLTLVVAFAAFGALDNRWLPRDHAEIGFHLGDSRITGEASRGSLDRTLYSIFSDPELGELFARELILEIEQNPGAEEWLRELLIRGGIEGHTATSDARVAALQVYFSSVLARHLGQRIQGSPARARADYWLYSPSRTRIHLYLGFGGNRWLPFLSEATARAFNRTRRELDQKGLERWQSEVDSFQDLLAERMRALSQHVDRLGAESETIRRRLLAALRVEGEASEQIQEELALWLESDLDRPSESYLPWLARLRSHAAIRPEILEQLAALRTQRQLQELLAGTDWLDAGAFGTRSPSEQKQASLLYFVPPIPDAQIPFSESRIVSSRGALFPPSWAAPVGSALIGLALALAVMALQEALRSWRRQGGST